jgi:multiple sugar transport system permease protein
MARAGLAPPGVSAGERAPAEEAPAARWRPPGYWPFVLPALVVVVGVIVFPWAFTLWMSLHEWKVGAAPAFVGLSTRCGRRSSTPRSRWCCR